MLRRVIADDSNETSTSLLRGLDYALLRSEFLREKAARAAAAGDSPQSPESPPAAAATRFMHHHDTQRNRLAPIPGAALARVREFMRESHDEFTTSNNKPPPKFTDDSEVVEWGSGPQSCASGPRKQSPLSILLKSSPTTDHFSHIEIVVDLAEAKDFFQSSSNYLLPDQTKPIPSPAKERQQISPLSELQKKAQREMWKRITFGMSDSGLPSPRTLKSPLAKSHRLRQTSSPQRRRSPQQHRLSLSAVSPSSFWKAQQGGERSRNIDDHRSSLRRRSSCAFWESNLTRLPSKHDVVIALNKAKSHFASVPLRKVSQIRWLRPSTCSDASIEQEPGSTLDGFRRIARLGLTAVTLARLGYAVSHTDIRLASLLDEINPRLSQNFALRGFGVLSEDSPSKCVKYVVVSTVESPWNLFVVVSAATSPMEVCVDDPVPQRFSFELSSQTATNEILRPCVDLHKKEFIIQSEEHDRLFIDFKSSLEFMNVIKCAEKCEKLREASERKALCYQWVTELRPLCISMDAAEQWQDMAAEELEMQIRTEQEEQLRRSSWRKLRRPIALSAVSKRASFFLASQKFSSWRMFCIKRKMQAAAAKYAETVTIDEWCARRADEILFVLTPAFQQMMLTEDAAPIGASMSFVGHSCGGAIATTIAIKMNASQPADRKLRVGKVFTVGSSKFIISARPTLLDDLGIELIAFGHRHDPALVLPQKCIPASPGFFDVCSGSTQCIVHEALNSAMATHRTECWRFHSIDGYVASFLDATAEDREAAVTGVSRRARNKNARGPWPFTAVLPPPDETVALFENIVFQGSQTASAASPGFTGTMVACLNEVFKSLSTNNRMSVDIILAVCALMQPMPPLHIVHERLLRIVGSSKSLRFTLFLAWVTREFYRDPSFIKKFLKALRWETENLEMVKQATPRGGPAVLTRPSHNEPIPLMSDCGSFSVIARTALLHAFSHYSRTFPVSPFDMRSTGVPVATFSCCCVMLSQMHWPSIGTSSIQFAEYAFTNIERKHTVDPSKGLMLHSGDCTENGFLAFLQLIVECYGEHFFLERLWTLGYNELFQHSITRGTMTNIHARGSTLCRCLTEDDERLRLRHEEENQFRRWVVDYITTSQQEMLDRAAEESLKKVHSIRCAPISALPQRKKSLHRLASVAFAEMPEDHAEDPLKQLYGRSPVHRRTIIELQDDSPEIRKQSVCTRKSSQHQLSAARRGTLHVNTQSVVASIYSAGGLQLLNDYQRRALGAQLVAEESLRRMSVARGEV